ncbi:MAG: hypothetical protein Q9216_001522 [Gyalolechia sp. 2 TL-2023]
MRSCKDNYLLAKDAYSDYKKCYTTLQYGGYLGDDKDSFPNEETLQDCRDPRLLVQTVWVHPHVAFWPTALRAAYAEEDSPEEIGAATEVDEHHVDRILLSLQPSLRVERREQLELMTRQFYPIAPALKAGMSDVPSRVFTPNAALCLLMTLLPNLTSLALTCWSPFEAILGDTIQRIADANREPSSPLDGKALTKLRKISIIYWDTEMGEDISCYRPFATLPSIQFLHGVQICGEEEFTWPINFPPRSSTVTTIDFTQSAVSAESFAGLLGGIPALKHFTYHYGGGIIGDADYEPGDIIDALRLHACRTLESMDIEGLEQTFGNYSEEKVAGSLHEFCALKSVRLEDMLFRIPGSDDDASSEDDNNNNNNNNNQGGLIQVVGVSPSGNDYDPQAMSRVVDLLPPPIEHIAIVAGLRKERTNDLLQGLVELKEAKVPRLQKLTLHYDDPFTQEMKEGLKGVGIELWVAKSRYEDQLYQV